ncbi:hypothetical protein GGTG_13477 [Gaeumannomyces tritici R3-111a-1]|uniref:Uncharacterized protein n=1 Tax=Gaeumannomyces tritici (strain R3-111a-1) TaxID=644352 RepID=J3PIZ5_GAET3|nr:hypothetical protein GGTG_13477 [Gaeumannomyces tritici R3-111a-1]EJT68971.1 hypothetical protein GGTG_13477 [Gaeumannomyces tritici R3-111a-1]
MPSMPPPQERPTVPRPKSIELRLVERFMGWKAPFLPMTVNRRDSKAGHMSRPLLPILLDDSPCPNHQRPLPPGVKKLVTRAQAAAGPLTPNDNNDVHIHKLLPSHTPREEVSWEGTGLENFQWIGMSKEMMRAQNVLVEQTLNTLCTEGGWRLDVYREWRFGKVVGLFLLGATTPLGPFPGWPPPTLFIVHGRSGKFQVGVAAKKVLGVVSDMRVLDGTAWTGSRRF